MRFAGPLSPEFFDKNLPPSTPLRRGGTPARAPTPGGALRSALKTPQRSDGTSPAAHPDLDLRAAFGASPVLKMPRNRRMPSVGEDEDAQVRHRAMAPKVTWSPSCGWKKWHRHLLLTISNSIPTRCSSGRSRRLRPRCRETKVSLPHVTRQSVTTCF